jgi:CubicO group peptidase (beta-lactamase class C family)
MASALAAPISGTATSAETKMWRTDIGGRRPAPSWGPAKIGAAPGAAAAAAACVVWSPSGAAATCSRIPLAKSRQLLKRWSGLLANAVDNARWEPAKSGRRSLSLGSNSGLRYPQAATDVDAVLGIRTAFSPGYSKSWVNPPRTRLCIGEDAVGTSGLGGQIGFADPAYRMAFGYTINQHAFGTGVNERG